MKKLLLFLFPMVATLHAIDEYKGPVVERTIFPNASVNADAATTAKIDTVTAVKDRVKSLACVTSKPQFIASAISFRCAGPTPRMLVEHFPHEDRYIKVYVTPQSKQTLLEGKGDYPVGTLVVKEKCLDPNGAQVELFTVMRKREPGYNPTVGDWEFLVLNHDYTITASGKIDSCAECHQRFAQTDFLSRVYLPKMTVGK